MEKIESDNYIIEYEREGTGINSVIYSKDRISKDLDTEDIRILVENAFKWGKLKEMSNLLNELKLLKVE